VRVVVVEDNEDLAEGLAVNLRREGYDVAVSRDGRHALTLLRAQPPDVVVLDVGLPGIDGFTLLERLRAEGFNCPVLMLTARGAEADVLEGFRVGADDYVTKPFRTMELLARVRVLARRGVRESASAAPAGASRAAGFTDEELVARYALTPRQAVVTRLLAEGLSNPEIAQALEISAYTARNHVEQVLAKLGVPSRGRVAATLRADYDRAAAEPQGA